MVEEPSWVQTSSLLKTANSGQSWDTLLILGSFPQFINIHFFDEDKGIFSGEYISRTYDGGKTIQGINYPTRKMKVISQNLILFTDQLKGIIYSTDQGVTVNRYPTTMSSHFWEIEHIENQNLIFGFSTSKKIYRLVLDFKYKKE